LVTSRLRPASSSYAVFNTNVIDCQEMRAVLAEMIARRYKADDTSGSTSSQ